MPRVEHSDTNVCDDLPPYSLGGFKHVEEGTSLLLWSYLNMKRFHQLQILYAAGTTMAVTKRDLA